MDLYPIMKPDYMYNRWRKFLGRRQAITVYLNKLTTVYNLYRHQTNERDSRKKKCCHRQTATNCVQKYIPLLQQISFTLATDVSNDPDLTKMNPVSALHEERPQRPFLWRSTTSCKKEIIACEAFSVATASVYMGKRNSTNTIEAEIGLQNDKIETHFEKWRNFYRD